jgi:putative lipoic acid-binding regulatory protein
MNTETPPSLLQFPCDFPIKAFGHSRPDFDVLVVDIIRRHTPNLAEGAVTSRPSHGGKFTAVTVTIQAESKAQLDAIYRDLTGCSEILMAL